MEFQTRLGRATLLRQSLYSSDSGSYRNVYRFLKPNRFTRLFASLFFPQTTRPIFVTFYPPPLFRVRLATRERKFVIELKGPEAQNSKYSFFLRIFFRFWPSVYRRNKTKNNCNSPPPPNAIISASRESLFVFINGFVLLFCCRF